MFRYNQIAALAHEGARWAAVHGKKFERTQHASPVTQADLFANVIAPRAAALDMNRLTCELDWDENSAPPPSPFGINGSPEAFFPEMNLTSTATSLVSN